MYGYFRSSSGVCLLVWLMLSLIKCPNVPTYCISTNLKHCRLFDAAEFNCKKRKTCFLESLRLDKLRNVRPAFGPLKSICLFLHMRSRYSEKNVGNSNNMWNYPCRYTTVVWLAGWLAGWLVGWLVFLIDKYSVAKKSITTKGQLDPWLWSLLFCVRV